MNWFQKIINSFITPEMSYKNIMGLLNYNKNSYLSIKDKNDALFAYIAVPAIRAIIDKKAEFFAKGQIFEENNKGEKVFNSILKDVFKHPHPFYSENEFLQVIAKQFSLFQEVFIYTNRKWVGSLLSEDDTLLVLPASMMKVNYKKDADIKTITSKYDYVIDYELSYNGKTITFKPEEIIHITSTSMSVGLNDDVDLKLKSIEKPINTMLSAYDIVIGLYRKNGGFGILSNNAKGTGAEMFNTKIAKSDIDDLQKELKNYTYNHDEWNTIITNAQLSYIPMSFPLKDMELTDNFKQAMVDICNVLNFPILSLNNLDASTFNNMEISDRKLYTDAIIPMWDLFASEFESAKFTANNIKFDYSFIPVLQDDKKTEYEAILLNDDIWIRRYKENVVTFEEMRIGIGLK